MKITHFSTVFILLYLSISNSFAQNIAEQLELHNNSHHLEKVYVNSDKSFYTIGDTIWCKAYFVDGRTHRNFDASPILHVEWLNSSLDIEQTMDIKITEGTAQFEIPTSQTGKHTLRAYTRYQRNFDPAYIFQKSYSVFNDSTIVETSQHTSEEFAIQFFPEGGELVAGLKNKLAFEALDINGNSIDIVGSILDDNNTTISSFKTFNDGLGFLEFTPNADRNYTASITYNGNTISSPIPTIKKAGYVLSASSRSKEFIQISLQSNNGNGLKDCQLIAHVRGNIILDIPLDEAESKQLKFSRSDIPSGIVHFTLFDPKSRPVSERLVFNKNPSEKITIDFGLDKSEVEKREEVNMSLQAYLQENATYGSGSITVYNADIIPEGTNELTIENYLLLQSDLNTHIQNINQYFVNNDAKTNILLDNLLLTKAWRRFNWADIQDEKSPIIEFDTEEDMPIVGRILKPNSDKPVKADVFLNTLSADDFGSFNMTTEDDGVFYFSGLNFADTTDIIIQANIHNPKKKKKQNADEIKRVGKKDVDIEILSLDPLAIDQTLFIKNNLKEASQLETIRKEFKEIQHFEKLYNPDWSIDLQEVTVKAQRKTERENKISDLEDLMSQRNMLFVSDSQKIFMEDLPGGGTIYQDIFQIIRQRVAGAQVRGDGNERYVVLRGSNSFQEVTQAAFFLDGVRVNNIASLSIDPNRILAIDVIKGLYAATLFGSDTNGGVISLITKDPGAVNGAKTKKAKGTINIKHPGYYKARDFYTPSYAKKSIDTERPDLRTTIFWNSDLRFSNKPNKLKFFTGDRTGNFIIKVEGITSEGIPFIDHTKLMIK